MKILVVLPRFPYPLDKGDKLRAYHQIVELSKHNEIHLFCVSHAMVTAEQQNALRPFCRSIRIVRLNRVSCYSNVVRSYFTAKSLQMGYWCTARAKRAYHAFEREVQPDVVYNQMVRTMPLVARSRCPKVMDFQDALSLNAERRMEQSRGLWRSILHFEFKMLRSSEYNAFDIFNALTIISEPDADTIPHKRNHEIHIVPNGVDFDYYSRDADFKHLSSTYDLCFCGNMSYQPNVTASRFLVERVMPLVWQHRPDTTLLLAGTSPKHSVSRLADDTRVTVSGRLPDIRSAYAASSLFVAPMQNGSGMQNKLLEAMSMGLPCITTTIANAPLGAEAGRHMIVADGAEAFAAAIVAMLGDRQRAAAIAAEGNAFVRQRYSWESAVAKLEKVFDEIKLETR